MKDFLYEMSELVAKILRSSANEPYNLNFNNMPVFVFFFNTHLDKFDLSLDIDTSIEVIKNPVEHCAGTLRLKMETNNKDGYVVAVPASHTDEDSSSVNYDLKTRSNVDLVVLYTFSKKLNQGVCYAFETNADEGDDGLLDVDPSVHEDSGLWELIEPLH